VGLQGATTKPKHSSRAPPRCTHIATPADLLLVADDVLEQHLEQLPAITERRVTPHLQHTAQAKHNTAQHTAQHGAEHAAQQGAGHSTAQRGSAQHSTLGPALQSMSPALHKILSLVHTPSQLSEACFHPFAHTDTADYTLQFL
jgi:hypothetical protein